MDEDKMSKQIVPLNVDYSSKKKGNLMRLYCKRPITRYLSSEYNFLYNKNIKEGMEENKMSKQIVPLNVDYSSKKEGKSNAIILKLRKGKMEWVFYDSLDKEQLKLILELVMHHVNTVK